MCVARASRRCLFWKTKQKKTHFNLINSTHTTTLFASAIDWIAFSLFVHHTHSRCHYGNEHTISVTLCVRPGRLPNSFAIICRFRCHLPRWRAHKWESRRVRRVFLWNLHLSTTQTLIYLAVVRWDLISGQQSMLLDATECCCSRNHHKTP